MTTTKFYVYPYTQHSHGSIMIAEELDGKRVKLTNSHYTHKPENVLINWGNGNCPYPMALNPSSAVVKVIDKVSFFKTLQGTGLIPPCAFSLEEAKANLSLPIVCRTLVEAADGEGIVIADNPNQLVNAKLYTQYTDKTSEYRIHMGRTKAGAIVVICRQKKYLSDAFTGDTRIWTGQETKLQPIETAVPQVIAVARTAFAKFPDLTFGAFDIIYNNSTGNAYVLEINSAPMMNSFTTKAYADFFRTFAEATSPTSVVVETIPTSPPEVTAECVATNLTNPSTAVNDAFTVTSGNSLSNLTGFVKAQLAAGHITKEDLEKYTPPVTEEILIQNYVNALSQ